MSGICGIVSVRGGPLDPELLPRMVETLSFRGPDRSGCWHGESAGLAHLALHTTRESLREEQPLVGSGGTLVLTADARVDNRDELVRALKSRGHLRLQDPTDADLIMAAYECWNEACLQYLIGDFAFAIWDEQRRKLFCARDHLGVKPFYYYWSGEILGFASQIRAILQLPGVSRQLDEVRIADYLIANFEDKTITSYKDILRLPPGHSMTVDHQGVRLQSFWSLDPSRALHLSSDEEYAAAFREIFTEAVGCRLRSVFPVGALLSGGLDSSSVACVARDLLAENGREDLHTFSAIFDRVIECDEQAFINAVVAQGGIVPHYLHADRLSPLTDLDRVIWHQDEAFFAPNLFMHWGLFRAAKERNIRVLFDGLDGDTTVSHGIAYLTELARTGHWIALFEETSGLAKHLNLSPWALFRRRVLKPMIPEFVLQVRQAQRGWRAANPTINPDFARRIGLAERLGLVEEGQRGSAGTEREEHYHRISGGMITFVLEVADKASSAFAIETRYPFFDKRLVEFCLALPAEQKISRGWTRIVLRRAMESILPAEIQWRGGKSNLGANFKRGLLTVDRELVENVILRKPESIAAYVDVIALREVYDRCLSKPTSGDTMIIWKAVSLALWLLRRDHTYQTMPEKGGDNIYQATFTE